MHRSPAGRVFTLTIADQGPVIVDVMCRLKANPLLRLFQVPVAAAVAGFVLSGCGTSELGDPESEVIGSANLSVIRGADSASVYLIDGSVAIGSGDDRGVNVGDYPVTQDLGALGSDQIAELLAVLLDPKAYEWEYSKGCIVTPGVRLSFRSDGRQVDILFCFECDILCVYRDGKLVSGGNFDFGRPCVVGLLQESFPNDPIIESLTKSPQ